MPESKITSGPPELEFWFSLVSPYAYLSAMRIDALADEAGVSITLQPMAMPPIYSALGWKINPFVDYPYKLEYVWRDIERLAAQRRLAFRKPRSFPQDPFLATQIALIGFEEGWGWRFSKAFYLKNFQDGAAPADPMTMIDILNALDLDAETIVAAAQDEEGIARLSRQTEVALGKSVFGAPFMFVDGERFWGDDRLETAIEWARNQRKG